MTVCMYVYVCMYIYIYLQYAQYDLYYYISVYAALIGVSLVLLLLSIVFLELTTLNASRCLHRRLVRRLVRAPARFFDVTPTGRIVNRLAGDTHILDEVSDLVGWAGLIDCLID